MRAILLFGHGSVPIDGLLNPQFLINLLLSPCAGLLVGMMGCEARISLRVLSDI